jgi:5-(carboxyamino)imidazole ribonucleotide synthase
MGDKLSSWAPPRLGILGGGQLGKMTAKKARKLGLAVDILDPAPGAPASQVADRQFQADLGDQQRIRELVESTDVTTVEIESVDAGVLKELAAAGNTIYPAPEMLAMIQDKYTQRRYFDERGFPQPRFAKLDQVTAEALSHFGYPLVQKSRRHGYDGQGVVVINGPEEVNKALNVPSCLEEKVDIAMEIAVLVARGVDGDQRSYPVVEMVFDSRRNILDFLLAPARIESQIAEKAKHLAMDAVAAMNTPGIFGVEMFINQSGDLLINEIAPRPHNSGHYTYEACVTSQFEQHVRAVCGLPLGSTELLRPSAMINLLGQPDAFGKPVYRGLLEALAHPGVFAHIYGKAQVRPFRKMGHVTIMGDTIETVLEMVNELKNRLIVEGTEHE